jgi:hypothetical protein
MRVGKKMASKKKSRKLMDPPWRPNFNQKERLPDTKVIRTDFILNFAAIFVAILVFGFLAYKETFNSGTRNSIQNIETSIKENSASNRDILRLFSNFNTQKNILKEAVEFDEHPLTYGPILRHISNILPKGMLLQSIVLQPVIEKTGRKSTVVYQVFLRGTLQDEAGVFPSEIIAEFQQSLVELHVFENQVLENNLSEFARNNQLKIYNFSIVLRLAKEKAK